LIYLLDTCVLSEATKPVPHRSVIAWLSSCELERQYVSTVTIGELHCGVQRLGQGRRRDKLRDWIETIQEDYSGRVVPFDMTIAMHWGRLRAISPNTPTVDGQLAATAIAYDFVFVTRNVGHFRFDGLNTVNPWES
jgi:predicted nucleic acid-binding protein